MMMHTILIVLKKMAEAIDITFERKHSLFQVSQGPLCQVGFLMFSKFGAPYLYNFMQGKKIWYFAVLNFTFFLPKFCLAKKIGAYADGSSQMQLSLIKFQSQVTQTEQQTMEGIRRILQPLSSSLLISNELVYCKCSIHRSKDYNSSTAQQRILEFSP